MIAWLWLPNTPNALKSLEFLDSPKQYRRHAYARAIDLLSACLPVPQSGGSGTGEPRPPSSATRSSPPATGSAPAVRDRPIALGLALQMVAAMSGGDGVGQAGHRDPMASSGIPSVLAMAIQIGAAFSGSRDSRSDSADEQRQPALGCASDSWRA